MKIISWNVNGIRACGKGGFLKWFEDEKADIVCVQEIKARPDQLELHYQNPLGYHAFWNPAEKPGYSGTAVFSKKEPLNVTMGLGDSDIDREGRVIILKYPKFTLINSYFPNSSRDLSRLPFKLAFCQKFLKKVEALRKKGENIVMCADWNIAHTELDIKNAKGNKKNAGFLPEEREWFDQFLNLGFVDTYRFLNPEKKKIYSWWSYKEMARMKNNGWRIDYICVTKNLVPHLKSCDVLMDQQGSDHCPVVAEFEF